MILDSLTNTRRYEMLHPLFPQAFSFLCSPSLLSMGDGRHDLPAPGLSANISTAAGKRKEEARLETHDRYLDIQCVLEGDESAGWRPASSCAVISTEYDSGTDIRFFQDAPVAWIRNRPGLFVVFYPEDAHAPMVSDGPVRKVVVKVPLL